MKFTQLLKEPKLKPLLDKRILLKRFKIKTRYLYLPLILIILFLINERYFVFGFLTILSATLSYYHDRYNRTPLDLKMPLFLGIFITRHYGLHFTLIFFIISDIIPTLISGAQIDGASIVFILWYFMINAVVLFFPMADIVILGIILVILETIGAVFIKSFFGYPGIVAVAGSVFSVLIRIVYFLTLGKILEIIFALIR